MTINLKVDIKKLKKVAASLVEIREKLIKVEYNVKLPLILGDKTHKKTMR